MTSVKRLDGSGRSEIGSHLVQWVDLDGGGGWRPDQIQRDQEFAFSDAVRVIELQEPHGDAAHRGQGDHFGIRELEVISPLISTRMKDRNNVAGVRVDRRKIAGLGVVAKCAGECHVLRDRRATVLFGNDMIDFVRHETGRFRSEVVFAALARPISDQSPKLRRDVSATHEMLTWLERSLCLKSQ